MSDDEYDRMMGRIDALFPRCDGGYGDDMRRMMRLAEHHNASWYQVYSDGIIRLLNELVGRMEADAREEAALDEYVTRMEAEALPR